MTPLVLLPGMNCTEDLWNGCGVDDALTPALDRESMDDQVGHLLAVLPRRFVLGGLSLGAIVAVELTLRAPERVTGLVLASTNSRAPTPGQRASWAGWRTRLDGGSSARELQGEILEALLTPEVVGSRPDLVARTLAMGDGVGTANLRRQLSLQESRTDLLARLPRLTLPTRVVSGTLDTICPPQFHTTIAASVPGAVLTALAAGHLVPLEQPAAFGRSVRAAVDEA